MTVKTLLADLAARDIRLSAAGDKLRVNAPSGALTAELRLTLSDHKPELLEALRQRTPGQYLADLSLRFADHPNHHAALSYFCLSADEYQQHGMSVIEAARHGYTAAVFAYGDEGAAAMLRPEILDKLPRPSAPSEQMLFVYQPPPQKRSRKDP